MAWLELIFSFVGAFTGSFLAALWIERLRNKFKGESKPLIQQVIHDFRRSPRVVVRNDKVLAEEERKRQGDV